VTLLRAEDRLVSHFQAGRYQSIAEVSDLLEDADMAAGEVGVALSLTRRAADAEHDLALLLSRFPSVRQALAQGEIDLRRARVIVEEVRTLEPDKAELALDEVLPQAAVLTTGQLRVRLQRIKRRLDASQARKQFEAGLEKRRVLVEANPDGTANLLALNLPPDKVMTARRRLNELARSARATGDERTHDQRRADTLLDLLTGRGHHPVGAARVDIVVPLDTLTGMAETPGHIPGWGPIAPSWRGKSSGRRIGDLDLHSRRSRETRLHRDTQTSTVVWDAACPTGHPPDLRLPRMSNA
jgi:hypothetical protein